jgi:hypothetical protein
MGKLPFWVFPATILLGLAVYELVVMLLQALLILPSSNGGPGW